MLVIVHTVTSGQRLLDTVRLLDSDLRIQVVFTMAPDVFSNGVAQFISSLGAVSLPWLQATQQRFDLAIAASLGALHEIHAPLIVMPHGAGFNKLVTTRGDARIASDRVAYGLDAQRLLHNGAVLPAAIVLSHKSEMERLSRTCPEALPVAVVIGDSSYDRLTASLSHRDSYRHALAAGPNQKLVVVSSTWGPRSLFGRWPSLLPRLLTELPRQEFRVVALLHPNVWFGHGTWQVKTWLADCLRRGLSLVPPEADWCAVLAAADWVIGDHGSATLYGTATGAAVMLAGFPCSDIDPASTLAELAAIAPRLSKRGSLRDQLARVAAEIRPGHYRTVTERITSAPGRFNRNMRHLVYRLLNLRQPATALTTTPASLPFLVK
ncbi:hypothetical protein [Streptosporangium subroseum]|uniref:hypothetical protein n=1 Tax=Streptosporangium subroseum TaxID=106412 RepID=UPI003093A178|nr:hypothetical protein OHB15_49335 [Streptosporangium subroseum]